MKPTSPCTAMCGKYHIHKGDDGANHSFYALEWEAEVLALTESWLQSMFSGSRQS